MDQSPKPPWWKRLWSWISTADTIRSVVTLLLGVGGGSAAVATADVSSRYGTFALEWWAAAVAAFCAGALLALTAGYVTLRIAPLLGRWWRKRFYTPPSLTVTAHSGAVATLEIENSGGRATLRATARILSVTGPDMVKRQDSYPLLWRPDREHAFIQAPHGVVTNPHVHL